MPPRNYPEDAHPGFSAALRRFEKLTLEEQLPLLAFFLREELGSIAKPLPRPKPAIVPAPSVQIPEQDPVAIPSPAPEVSEALPRYPPAAQGSDIERSGTKGSAAERSSAEAFAAGGSAAELLTPANAPGAVAATSTGTATAKLQVIVGALLPDTSAATKSRHAGKRTQNRLPGTAASTRPRALSIAATMAICFPLSLALMLWRRPPVDVVPAVQWSPMQPAFAGTDLPVQAAPVVQSSPAEPSQPAATTAQARGVASQANAIARGGDPKAMPVTLYFRRRGFHSDPYDRRKINWYMEGRLTNLSDVPMNIEVRAESSGALGASQIQIDVEPHNERDFGVDDGLEMHPGDKVTVMSAPYSDLVVGGVH